MKQVLSQDEVRFHPASYQDEAGRLFHWEGGLYRGISAASAPFLAGLVESAAFQKLVADKRLIETEIAPFAIEGFPLVLRHRRLPFVSYPFEWSGPMMKAASLAVIDLARALARADLMLKDAHLWNVLFDGSRPVWVDITSIVPLEGRKEWPAAAEFHDECVYPLILLAQGRPSLARWLLAQDNGMPHDELETLGLARSVSADVATLARRHLSERHRRILRRTLQPLRHLRSQKPTPPATFSLPQQLEALKAEIENISLPATGTRAAHPPATPEQSSDAKQRSLQKILDQTKPRTVLDLASGSGWYSELAANFAAHVVAFDSDATAAAQLFRNAEARQLSILPLVMDFTRPSPSRGLASHSHIAATERFPCEMVLLLGFLHDLVFRYRRLGLNEICDGLAAFSQRWVVVEFIPGDDPEVAALQSDWFAGYTLENLKTALSRYFPKIEIFPSQPDSRVLLLGEK
ncbi:MAG: class I SAM-dependent methyltransferase [Chthoniobacterales bacterium]